MSSEVLVRAEGVSKKFCRSFKRSLWYGLRDIAAELNPFARSAATQRADGELAPAESTVPSAKSRLREGEFWAVNDVSFELKRGECLGLIGPNGAGKTTLLKMLNGLIKPDRGYIEMHGRVGALIALGAGFNPILTGRENVYVNASVLGLTAKEIEAKMDDIIDFAEIREFIDSPVQTYSSGMQVRLGFAVATAVEPDILFLDEVLAVGDAGFRHKCYHRISRLMSRTAVIMVSHNMDYIGAVCSFVAVMNRGEPKIYRATAEGIAAYNDLSDLGRSDLHDGGRVEAVYPPIRSAKVNIVTPEVEYGGRLSVEVDLECEEDVSEISMAFTAINRQEQQVMVWHSRRKATSLSLVKGRQLIRFHIDPMLLHDGIYRWNCVIARVTSIEHLMWFVRAGNFKVVSPYRPFSDIPYIPDASSWEHIVTSA